ncbi:hypothetical protein Desca_2479 [Desulfotomaculum nigrificans CO-1-SRB]|uniref:Uncharacterized protein n=2 Tax=Desulfotomaculum nigrificans TaxID=1565 RepID=F6B4C9_DESCC|nr:hypothetical protein Desca_2479 [Desulfotomaculum nigrificans CO-1-SRB]
MEKYFEKMKEYLNMDSEISYEEFNDYYSQVIAFLNDNYQHLSNDETVKARFILSILVSNSQERAKKYKPLSKKYRKIAEKSNFWAEALTYQLLKRGMTKQQIIQAEKELHDAV